MCLASFVIKPAYTMLEAISKIRIVILYLKMGERHCELRELVLPYLLNGKHKKQCKH